VSLRLLSYNIRLGGTNREKALAGVVNACDADLVVLQEAIHPEVVERLAGLCGMKAWAAARGYSLAFMSRVDVEHYAWHRIRIARRRYMEIVLGGGGTRVFGVHLSAVHSNVTELRRNYEMRALLRGISKYYDCLHLLTGDFNTLSPGERLDIRRLPPRLRAVIWMTGGNIRWTTIRLMLDGGYTDGYRTFHKDEGYTFPTWDPHVRLDYAFLPTPFAPRLLSCEIVRDAPGIREASDHFPLLSEIADA
jgi:endonuclease/exonuclease/phosphatase family metal-dependent hydrolase